MQKLLNECVSWLNWRVVAVWGIAILAVVWYTTGSSWRLWLSASPLLALILCALPCLLPVVWLWRKGADSQ